MDLAKLVSYNSKDKSTKVGCVITNKKGTILSTGFNDFPKGVNDNDVRRERPEKYKWTEHAERNAIYNAAKHGFVLKDSIIYLMWFPCIDCARAIIQSGITKIICVEPDYDDPKWGEDFKVSKIMFEESGVEIEYFKDEV